MKEKIHIWIGTDLKEQLQNYCSLNKITISQLTRKLLKNELNKE